MDYKPNIDAVCWFVDEIFPTIKRQIDDISFYIVGSNPSNRVHSLAHHSQGVFVTGYVKDVRPYIKNATLAIVPLRIARGVQTKILESIALGCPTVATEEATQGLPALIGNLVSVSRSNAEDFAAKALDTYEARAELKQRIDESHNSLRDKLSWENELSSLIENLES